VEIERQERTKYIQRNSMTLIRCSVEGLLNVRDGVRRAHFVPSLDNLTLFIDKNSIVKSPLSLGRTKCD